MYSNYNYVSVAELEFVSIYGIGRWSGITIGSFIFCFSCKK
jgi:hypothetical protein